MQKINFDYNTPASPTTMNTFQDNIENAINAIYPVGAIYLSVNNVNPGTFLTGTWEQIQGRYLLGAGTATQNTSDAYGSIVANEYNFEANDKIGAYHKTIDEINLPPSTMIRVSANDGSYGNNNWSGPMSGWGNYQKNNASGHNSNQDFNVIPPSLVVYMWQRVS